jgi:Rad3-related DNA helicase
MLRHHFTTEKPTIIVSPSVSTGVSFDNERSRFQVIAKIPYPSLASQKNKMRQKTYPDWYSWRTVAELIQACGRSVRNHKDYADTIIIDGSFSDVLKFSSHYMPLWFQESIKTFNG